MRSTETTATLEQLHLDIQAAFGWAGYHMWSFSTGHADFGIPDPELGFDDAAAMTLRRVAPSPGDRLRYTYDFGDGWEHAIVVETVTAAESDVSYPRCLTGRRACPPEDSGGMWGYADLQDILADPTHPEHTERLEWLGLDSADQFDLGAFDLGEATRPLPDTPLPDSTATVCRCQSVAAGRRRILSVVADTVPWCERTAHSGRADGRPVVARPTGWCLRAAIGAAALATAPILLDTSNDGLGLTWRARAATRRSRSLRR